MKIDDKQLKDAVAREAKNAILKQGVQIKCKKCGAEFSMHIESGPCPHCGAPYDLAFKLQT